MSCTIAGALAGLGYRQRKRNEYSQILARNTAQAAFSRESACQTTGSVVLAIETAECEIALNIRQYIGTSCGIYVAGPVAIAYYTARFWLGFGAVGY